MNYWLMKSEPDTFSIDDLKAAKRQTNPWDGVRNFQARNFMRQMKVGDLAFFYHSSCAVPAIVGIVTITREAYPDPSAWDPNSPYFDPKSTLDNPRWSMVEVTLKEKLAAPITLQMLKANPKLADLRLVQRGNRLSVMPISHPQWRIILNSK